MDSDHSVTAHIANLRLGQDLTVAHQFIWDRYFTRLAALAQKRLGGSAGRAVSGEDVASTALAVFFDRICKDGAFPDLKNREQLWPLLLLISQRRAINAYRAETRKHLGGRLRGDSVFVMANRNARDKLDEAIARDLTPESADDVVRACNEVLEELKRYDQKFDPPRTQYHEIAVCLLHGLSTTDTAKKLGFQNKKTIERAIKEIRVIWKCMNGGLATVDVDGGSSKYETSLATEPLVIGRQRKGEPAPIWDAVFNVDGATIRRLVISNDSRISRNHCRIQVRDETRLVVANISKRSEIVVGSEKLLAGDSLTISGDGQVAIPGFSIRVRLN